MPAPPEQESHTYGPECRLAPVPFPPEADPEIADIPPLKAQFFYPSLIPIHDAPSSAASDAKPFSAQQPQRPFSQADNNALEKAWLSFASNEHRRAHSGALRNPALGSAQALADSTKLSALCRHLARKHTTRHRQEPLLPLAPRPCCPDLRIEAGGELESAFCGLTRRRLGIDEEAVVAAVMAEIANSASPPEIDGQAARSQSAGLSLPAAVGSAQSGPPPARIGRPESTCMTTDGAANSRPGNSSDSPVPPSLRPRPPPANGDGISGKPFIRVDTPGQQLSPSSIPRADVTADSSSRRRVETAVACRSEDDDGAAWDPPPRAEISVGSRLYYVTLPDLQMRPIYWSPIHDIAVVQRATWFYRDTMAPLEPAVANQLEAGYRELRPWSEAWSIELRCAIEVGALGEEKVTQPLWKQHGAAANTEDAAAEPSISSDPFCAARCFRGCAAASGTLKPAVGDKAGASTRSYANWHVLFKNAREAYLLKPSLRPSAYYSRTPVSRIKKGTTVGIPVVRGFDWDSWRRIHDQPKGQIRTQRATSPNPSSRVLTPDTPCAACASATESWRDLVLVIHGIGQKFAERVESFHFTHAVNAFRRAVNAELGSHRMETSPAGIMVLPVNWRHLLSFEDGGPMQSGDEAAVPGFGLKDIEPRTIPAVRGLISDVMFDVPYYLSHHKPRMIEALIREANRIYRLWCRNNPGFVDQGRVHLVAHSLGSVMALDVLSNQPTNTPPLRDPIAEADPDAGHFEFDSTNLFLLGSPAGFFLLLERAQLVPREGRLKPGADPADVTAKRIVGSQGQFGCLAVDNIYNILAREDPVAYLLNGTIDPLYAASLREAYVPTTATFLQSVGNSIKGLWRPGPTQAAGDLSTPKKPPTFRLPSQLELEVHDFTREEIAERKAFLINDNGQVDFYLSSGGGPLELQYLNMLHAHSSYWTSPDLVRMLCMEITRKPGRSNTHPSLRATKAAKRAVPRAD